MSDKDYEIGYKKPPKHSRFKTGQTGNKNGRPHKEENQLCDIVSEVFFNNRKVQVNGKQVNMNYMRMAMIKLAEAAAKGSVQATRLMLDLARQAGYTESEIKVILPFIPTREQMAERFKLEEMEKNNL